jgi:hypothetical protein
MRIDHCHFTGLKQGRFIWVYGWIYGVADHNVFDNCDHSNPFLVQYPNWGGSTQKNGNGSWADYPWYGTEKFFFIEDCTFLRTGRPRGVIDSMAGGRFVWRHNYMANAVVADHGTEGAAQRGARVHEVYGNTFDFSSAGGQCGFRSGTTLFHDNQILGVPSASGNICSLQNFREAAVRGHPIWGIADGTSVWDQNDTEGNGTYVEGHPPYLFDSGTDTSSVNSNGVIHDSTKNWTPNRWVGYSIKNTNPHSASYNRGSFVISNTSNTITYNNAAGPFGPNLVFNSGDTYEIHRVLTMMDQNGRGKGDQIRGDPPINTTTGTPFWPHQALEPCYSWNNIYTPNGQAMGYGVPRPQPTTKLNVDFFNLGAGFPADSTPSQVSSTYKAALNGVDYVGTFVYPHPLVTATSTPPPSGTPMSKQHLLKKEGKKREAKKKRRWPKKVGE